MNTKTLLVALFCVLCAGVAADNYAVLVAGSNGYSNYRHQADICHAYHTLLAKGFPAENIIVFSYNDVAKSTKNPFKGQLFNKPTYKNPGVNVNAGCVIDYEGADVTPANYLAVIKGQADKVKGGNKRVLTSGPNDHVFLNFADHGAPGLVAFPSKNLYANDLLAAFQYMFENQMYARLVYYLEACESGSMFQNLPKNLNIYALSAANPTESSWAAYCGTDAVVGGKNIGSCLGDLFSVNWMEDTDARTDINDYPLQQQFEAVKIQTSKSQVMQWGDLEFSSEALGDFIGPVSDASSTASNEKTVSNMNKIESSLKKLFNFRKPNAWQPKAGLLDSRQAMMQYLIGQFSMDPSAENYKALQSEIKAIEKFARKFVQIAKKFVLENASNSTTTNFECYASTIDTLTETCGKIPDAQLGNLKYLYSYCSMNGYTGAKLNEFIREIC